MKNYKSNRIVNTLQQRIAAGDYALREFPSERALAASLSVSYLTARKAVQLLVEQGVLVRDEQGRAMLNPGNHQRLPRVGFLAPAFRSWTFDRCRQEVIKAGNMAGMAIRPMEFVHWDDPVILDALHGLDGLFVCPTTDAVPQNLLAQIKQLPCKVAFFDRDLTEHGLVNIQWNSRQTRMRLFEHLRSQGYTRIDCVNCQGHGQETLSRIDSWRQWINQAGIPGQLHDLPTASWHEPTPNGYALFKQIIHDQPQPDHAFICTTLSSMQGAMRAAYEHNLHLGEHFGLACFDSPPDPRFLCPTITCLQTPDALDVCSRVFDWFKQAPGTPWQGSFLIHPQSSSIYEGESTQLVPQLTDKYNKR
jgi:hypothetical protein